MASNGSVTETVAVTGSSNTIASSAGVGLSLGSMTVGSDGMNFKSITSAGAAHGINLVDVSGGSITVAGGSISNTTDSAFNVVGGSVNVNYTGLITQNNNAAAVSVTGGHSGALTFMSIASGSDVIATTNGTGLQFNNANGTYNFDQISVGGADTRRHRHRQLEWILLLLRRHDHRQHGRGGRHRQRRLAHLRCHWHDDQQYRRELRAP